MIICLAVALAWCGVTHALAASPLKPIDTSSPRSTLQGFLETSNAAYDVGFRTYQAYLDSSRLYLTADEAAAINETGDTVRRLERALDTSALPPLMAGESSRRLAVQLKEVLDRIALPPAGSIPDAQAMVQAEFKRWAIPDTEIRIARVETGPRAGEYLFTPDTLQHLPEFYTKVKSLPYGPGATPGWYDFATYSPVGLALALRSLVPPRWVLGMPDARVRTLLFDQPLWRWLAIFCVALFDYLLVRACFRLGRRWSQRTRFGDSCLDLARPLSIVLIMPLTALIFADVLRVSGGLYEILTRSLWTVFFLALTWLAWVVGSVVAESVIALERLRTSSIDSQLIRLLLRMVTLVVAVAILVAGADRIGLPAYSVLAGLGVGGLAVALAAQQTLANLLGSLIIMIEKPFAVGHLVKLQDFEGIVEDIGFRSTRIRTLYNSLVSIPSSLLVNAPVDNLELRRYRQLQTTLNLIYDTPPDDIEAFAAGIQRFLLAQPSTDKEKIRVALHQLGSHSLDILVDCFILAPDRDTELAERQRLLLGILRLAESQGIRFAFPTQTVYVAAPSDATMAGITP